MKKGVLYISHTIYKNELKRVSPEYQSLYLKQKVRIPERNIKKASKGRIGCLI